MTEFSKNKHLYLAVVAINILGFIGGTLLTWTSPVLPKLGKLDEKNPLGRVISASEKSLIGSFSSIGGIVGPLIYGFIFEHLGRKIGSILVLVPYAVSFLMGAFGETVGIFYVTRILAGIGIGASFCIGPMYIGEVAPKHNRGFLATTTTVFIMAGCLFSYCVGPFTSIMVFNLILLVFPLIGVFGIAVVVPESPYYLVQKHKDADALKSLQILRNSTSSLVNKELDEIRNDVFKIREGGILDIFKSKATTKACFISTMLVNLQNFSGILVVLTYTQQIFEATGSNFSSDLSSIIVGTAQFLTVFTTPVAVERLGRKPLLLISTTGIIVTLSIIGAFFHLKTHNVNVDSFAWVPLAAFILYFASYNAGTGSLPWAILAEIYPLNVKSAGTSFTTSSYWLSAFILNYYFSSIADAIGMGETFWLFAGICCFTVVFVYFCVIETKGKTLQEIQDILAR